MTWFWFMDAKHGMQMWTDLRVSGFVLSCCLRFCFYFCRVVLSGDRNVMESLEFLILKIPAPYLTLSLPTSDTCLDFLNKNLEVNM